MFIINFIYKIILQIYNDKKNKFHFTKLKKNFFLSIKNIMFSLEIWVLE